MKEFDQNKPLLSIHIPKCGGMSFVEVLKKWFGSNLKQHFPNEIRGKMPKQHKLYYWYNSSKPRPICIHGHFNANRNFGVSDYYPDVDQAITFMRDPLEIAISVYYYSLKTSKDGKMYRDGKLVELPKTVEEHLDQHEPYVKNFLPSKEDQKVLEEHFENYYVHVGVMDYYQESINLLAEKLGKRSLKLEHKNISERREKPSQSVLDAYRAKCAFEYFFYEKALKMNQPNLREI